MNMQEPVDSVKGVGSAVAGKLSILGIKTVGDLINYFPRRYDDYSSIEQSARMKPGNVYTIKAVIKQATGRYVRRGLHITEAVASDDSGSIRLIWFNQPYRASAIKPGDTYFISGSFELSRGRLALMNPNMELASNFPVNTARIVPIYRETKGLKSAAMRKAIASIRSEIQAVSETLPPATIEQAGLMSRSQSLLAVHFPSDPYQLEEARRRLAFEELFAITVASLINKQQFAHESGVHITFDEELAQSFTGQLPYDLTNSQRKVIWQIYQDFEATTPMNRLVEGDVGSGKTIVAAMAAAMAIRQGYQVAMMAPTELLARQHSDTLHELMKLVGMEQEVILLVGSMKAAQKKRAHQVIKTGEAKFIIGTHALITESVDLRHLGLVIIDEQHRFGVAQRKKLQAKAGHMPHVLSMTATPIPRTLALTLYGELDVSIIDELPPGRTPVNTEIISPNSRKPMYDSIEKQLAEGRQMFVVCPLIEDSEALASVLSAETVHKGLSQKYFPNRHVGLLHGKMKSEEKDAVMAKFIAGKLDILVSTTVIEVGVNVPNATIMLIEGAERFGLAQAHQLRGRVGRGAHQGYCYLIMSDSKEPTQRLRALVNSTDGFKLAEMDLEIRGPGAIYGHMQSGQLDLRVANLGDMKLIVAARSAAQRFLDSGENLSNYSELQAEVDKYRSVTNLN